MPTARTNGKKSLMTTKSITPSLEIDSFSGDPNFMTSLARGLTVIRAFSEERQSMSISQISHKTGIPRAAVRRCLYTLMKLGYVNVDNERLFSLRPKILTLGYTYLSFSTLATAAQPILDHVSNLVRESCSIAVLDKNDIVYIARSQTSVRIMSVDLSIGSRLPAYCTSMGRVLLASLPQNTLKDYLSNVKIKRHTNRTIFSITKLQQVIEKVRRKGYAIIDQELEIGLQSIAVPIEDRVGKVVAAMNIGTHSSRSSIAEMETKFLPPLKEAAHELGLMIEN
jgi:IclR family transcriptional regulator, pca regulon regulatory protein